MTTTQAIQVITSKVDRFWTDRALEMFRHLTVSNSMITTISKLRVAGDWPRRGSITFVRDADGRKCRMWLAGSKFKAIAK